MFKDLMKTVTAVVVAFTLMKTFFSAMQGQTPPVQTVAAAPANPDAEMAVAQTQLRVLQIQKNIESLTAQEQTLENQQTEATPVLTTDAAMAQTQAKIKVLEIKKQIAALQAQQLALLNPPAPVAPAAAPPTPVNCVPQPGPKVTIHAPPKAATWACQHLGVCTDNKPVQVPVSGACPAGTAPAAGSLTK